MDICFENHYLCDISNSQDVITSQTESVVICSKILTFAI